uniref:Valine--tRNA ligase n=1 Tax=Ignisphaera aggregans TaxID=334771 RepID=A0A7C2VDL1_9CREN
MADNKRKNFVPKLSDTRWNKEYEVMLSDLWEKEGHYRFSYDPSRPTLIIDTPPPYISGRPHIGQVASYIQMDMIARAYRMMGYNVLMPFYGDRNGLPVEIYVERTYNINPHEAAKTVEGREKFLELCRKHLDDVEKTFVSVWRMLGCTFEYWKEGTDSEEYRKITQETFIKLWREGLIYEADRPVIWCPRCRTSLAEAEVEYKEEVGELYHIVFPVQGGDNIVIATTRPELLGACLVVAYNPEDNRYKHFRNRKAVVPVYNLVVDIVEHASVDPRFGTGIMMICSYGDQADVRVIRELGLQPRIIIDENGLMNEKAGPLTGLSIPEARKKIVEILREQGYLVKVEKIKRNVPSCWRCGSPVEFIHTREYFLKQLEFKDVLKEVAAKIEFIPEEYRQRLFSWIDSLAMDWPISRSRYYATELPVWKCSRCGSILVPKPGRYYRPWKDPAPWDSCPKCGAPKNELVGETKVFDTWFDSSISVLYASGITKYPHIFELYVSGKTKAMRPQGYEIIRTWLYYTLLRIYQLYKKPAFDIVRINGMGLDEKGEAMHKSKGNIIFTEPMVEKYGADAVRYWAAVAAKIGSDYRVSEQVMKTGMLFVTKLLNISRFISMFPVPERVEKLHPLDLAILEKLNEVVASVRKSYEKTDVYTVVHTLYSFVWNVFADHYIELVKARAYGSEGFTDEEQKSAWYTLNTALRYVLLMLAPIMPFVTDYIWRKVFADRSIHLESMPEPNVEWNAGYAKVLDKVIEINSAIWRYKKQNNMKLSEPLNAVLYIASDVAVAAKDLQYLHKIRDVAIGRPEAGEYIELAKDVYLSVSKG